MKKYSLGVIGCGNMAQSILRALTDDTVIYLLRANGYKLSVSVSDTDTKKLDCVRSPKIKTFTDNSELVSQADVVIFAVKPQVAEAAVDGIDFGNKIVMSIMAGVTLKRLKTLVGGSERLKLVRIMPNLNARVGCSVNAYCQFGLDDGEEDFVINILGAFGQYYKVSECMMNSITALTGSGPAFAFMFIDAFIKKGIACGFDAATAKQLALDTLSGSIENVRGFEGDISDLIDSVCSKGGTTVEGVNRLRESNFADIVSAAIDASEQRSKELEKSL